MDDDLELTPEALDAWGRAMAEIERRSQVCADAARLNWGAGRNVDGVRLNP
jgi:hypothetical protein